MKSLVSILALLAFAQTSHAATGHLSCQLDGSDGKSVKASITIYQTDMSGEQPGITSHGTCTLN